MQAAAGSALESSGDAQDTGHFEVNREGLQRGDAEELCATGIEGYFRNVAEILRPEVWCVRAALPALLPTSCV